MRQYCGRCSHQQLCSCGHCSHYSFLRAGTAQGPEVCPGPRREHDPEKLRARSVARTMNDDDGQGPEVCP